MATVDITVMGAGVLGLSVGFACARRGARVQVIDPHGVATGASGGVVGALAPHVPENWNAKKAFQLDSLLMAADFWTDVAALSGQDPGYARSGRLQPLADDRAVELARMRERTARDLWQGRASWRVIRPDNSGWTPPSPRAWIVHDTLSALIHPRKATLALARAFVAIDGQINAKAAPQGRVVWATGWPGITQVGGTGVKGQAALLRHDAAGQPQLYIDGVHIIPHGDGTVGVGSTSERIFEAPDDTDTQLDDLLERARQAVPALRTAPVLERWSAVRARSVSRAPILGAHPAYPGEYIVNGGFKIGFGMAPKIAQVMADLLLDGQDTIPDDFKA